MGGAGGQFPTMGVGSPPFSQFNRPEVEIYCLNLLNSVLIITANNTTVRSFSLHGDGTNVIGTVNIQGGDGPATGK